MSEVIYRKYRPQKFGELVNQEHVRKTLENEVATGKIAHAYLFTGPRGIGKTTTARILAKAVNCLNRKQGQSEPCNRCEHCQEITSGRFLDLIEIDAASHTGVDNVRQNIIENTRFAPHRAEFKVFIIDEVHMLSISAFNALLKTLEEPPAHVIFILCTTEPYKIPETIISRCQRFDFKKVGVKELVERLKGIMKKEGVKADKEVLTIIAVRSEGCIRDAESLLQQILSLGEKDITMDEASLVLPRSDITLVIQFSGYLFQNKIARALELINNLMEEGVDLEQFASDLIEFLRKLLVYKINPESDELVKEIDNETEKRLQNLSSQVDVSRLAKLLNLLIEKQKELKQSDIPQLPLELLVVEFCETGQENTKTQKHPSTQLGTGKNTKTINDSEASSDNRIIEQSDIKKTETDTPNINSGVRVMNEKIGDITFESIKNSWEKILTEVRKRNHSISAFLKTGHLISFQGQILEIGFPYRFHQERIKDIKNRKIIETCILQVLGEPIKIETKILETKEMSQANEKENDEVVGKMLETFGGELIEE